VEAVALRGIRGGVLPVLQLDDLGFELSGPLANDSPKALRLRAKLLVRNGPEPRIVLVDRIDDRLNAPPLTLMSRTNDGADDSLDHACLCLYSPADAM